MNFEEEFPELKNGIVCLNEWDDGKKTIYAEQETILKFCLSRQRVKEAIEKILDCPNGKSQNRWTDIRIMQELKKELNFK